ncbi:MAG: type III pantothenate kinase [Methylacidiphilales bacterium]|nr:type III pantothenate kinase [Candidatus Methylacidiphilales bacterium]MDW8349023.1 type III pantothenate kinase [Verrucomicrobiae bacterium]
MPTAQWLLVDVSNSYTKWCWASPSRMQAVKRVATSKINPSWFQDNIWNKHPPTCVYLSSVVPSVTDIFKRQLQVHGTALRLLHGRAALPISLEYPRPETIGADRLANAIGAQDKYGAPAIVVDFGTAVTFDIINADGAYCGGVIAPGLSLMTEYLHEKTALLPLIQLRRPHRTVGKSTAGAIRAGAYWGYSGLVKEILARVVKEQHMRSPTIVATGGDAAFIIQALEQKVIHDPTLTLHGLWRWGVFLQSCSH